MELKINFQMSVLTDLCNLHVKSQITYPIDILFTHQQMHFLLNLEMFKFT